MQSWEQGTGRGAERLVFEVTAPSDRLLWEKGDGPMWLSAQQHPEGGRGLGCARLFPIVSTQIALPFLNAAAFLCVIMIHLSSQ